MDKGCSRTLLSLIVMFLPENFHCKSCGEAIQASTWETDIVYAYLCIFLLSLTVIIRHA